MNFASVFRIDGLVEVVHLIFELVLHLIIDIHFQQAILVIQVNRSIFFITKLTLFFVLVQVLLFVIVYPMVIRPLHVIRKSSALFRKISNLLNVLVHLKWTFHHLISWEMNFPMIVLMIIIQWVCHSIRFGTLFS